MASSLANAALLLLAILRHAVEGGDAAEKPGMFIFGDSLADVGNNNGLSTVPMLDRANFLPNGVDFPGGRPTGRFSNGYNGVDFIAKFIGYEKSPPAYLSVADANQLMNGTNFASAGSGVLDATDAGTISLRAQVDNFRAARSQLFGRLGRRRASAFLARSLFLFVTANNDMFAYYASAATEPRNETADARFVSDLYAQFETQIKAVHALGARKIWISGPGKIGCVPYLRARNPSGGCIDDLNRLAAEFNAIAMARLPLLRRRLPGLRYSYSNSYTMTARIESSPSSYGLRELAAACCGAGRYSGEAQCTVNATICDDRAAYYFWDWFHPTEAIFNLTSVFAYYGPREYASPFNIKKLLQL